MRPGTPLHIEIERINSPEVCHVRARHMHRLLLLLAMALTAGGLLFPKPGHAQTGQILPPTKPAAHVRITEGPALESVRDNLAIIRWTSNNPGGTDEHFGIVHYGTDPGNLSQTAKSHIRLNQNHPIRFSAYASTALSRGRRTITRWTRHKPPVRAMG